MQTRIQVLASELKQFPAKDGRQAGQFQILQCVIHGEKTEVGVLRVFGDMAKDLISAGDYVASFEVGVDFRTKDVVPKLKRLDPFKGGSAGRPAFDSKAA